jgi:hypothetical protein
MSMVIFTSVVCVASAYLALIESDPAFRIVSVTVTCLVGSTGRHVA